MRIETQKRPTSRLTFECDVTVFVRSTECRDEYLAAVIVPGPITLGNVYFPGGYTVTAGTPNNQQ